MQEDDTADGQGPPHLERRSEALQDPPELQPVIAILADWLDYLTSTEDHQAA